MAITAIVSFSNMSAQPLTLESTEDRNEPCNSCQPGSGRTVWRDQETSPTGETSQCCNIWIPWCDTASWFDKKHVTLSRGGTPLYYIWQAKHADGDFIRYSTTGYEQPGTPIPGDAEVTRNRDCGLTVDKDFNLKLWTRDPSVEIPNFPHDLHYEHMQWHMTQHPGDEFLHFHRDFLRRFHEWYDSQPFADQSLVAPWPELPADFLQPGDFNAQHFFNEVADFQQHPEKFKTERQFGDELQGPLHAWLHHIPITTLYRDTLITNFSTAPMTHNFYRLHGLINAWWRQWVGAEFVSISGLPATVDPGQHLQTTINYRNTGFLPWKGGSTQLGSQDPTDNTTWGTKRVAPTGDVAPEAVGAFTLHATAPSVLGDYTFRWQLVNDAAGRWFGPLTPPRMVRVQQPGLTTVPDVEGYSRAAATTAIRSAGLVPAFAGSGTWVLSQRPPAGDTVTPQSTVHCHLRGGKPSVAED